MVVLGLPPTTTCPGEASATSKHQPHLGQSALASRLVREERPPGAHRLGNMVYPGYNR